MRQVVSNTQNLLTYSEQFDNAAWTKQLCTITANTGDTLDPAGGNTADIIVEDGSNGIHGAYRISTAVPISDNQIVTFSVYLKAATRTWAQVVFNSGNSGVYFDLVNGVAGTSSGNLLSAEITAVGNSWFRCSVTFNYTFAVATIAIYAATADGGRSYASTLTQKATYVWGAQTNLGETPCPYVQAIASVVGQYGCRKISRVVQNLVKYSQDFTKAAWSKSYITPIATLDTTDPFGGNNAQKLTDSVDGGAVAHYITQLPSGVTTGDSTRPFVQSVYAKKGTKTIINVLEPNFAWGAYFDLDAGTVTNISAGRTATIESVGNGWYRCTVFHPALTAGIGPQIGLVMCNSTAAYTYVGDGTGTIYVYGAQHIRGTVTNTYIATTSNVFGLAGPKMRASESLDDTRTLVDGNMEAATTSAWTSDDSGVLTKETGTPHSGTNCLRITYGGAASAGAFQAVGTLGQQAKLAVWLRASVPLTVYIGIGSGNTRSCAVTTSWQYFTHSGLITTTTRIYVARAAGLTTGNWVECDDASLVLTNNLLSDGDMEDAGIVSWTVYQTTASKQTTNPHSGTQCIRIAHDGSHTYGGVQQTVLSTGQQYRTRGWARGDGTSVPDMWCAATLLLWTGTSSTAWQYFDYIFTASGNSFYVYSDTLSATHYVEFDDVSVAAIANDAVRYQSVDQQNLLIYSETYNAGGWIPETGMVATNNFAANPIDGAMTAAKLDFTGCAIGAGIYQSGIAISSKTPCMNRSIWLRMVSGTGSLTYRDVGTWANLLTTTINLTETWQRYDLAIPTAGTTFAGTSWGLWLMKLGTTGAVLAWGAQASATNGPIAYVKTTGGVHNPTTPRFTAFLTQNLLLNSQVFTSWTAYKATPVLDGTVPAPDGSSTTDKVTDFLDVSPYWHGVYQTISTLLQLNVTYTFSVYLKKGTLTKTQLWTGPTGNIGATFNLDAGTTSAAGGCTSTIESAPNGFYRCSITYVVASVTTQAFYVVTANAAGTTTYQGDGTGTIYVWGAQVCTNNVASPYIATTTTAVNVV